MSESAALLTKLLNEALEINTDQILMISRSQESHLYFLSRGRVQKSVPFEIALAQIISEEICCDDKPLILSEQQGRRFSFDCELVPNEVGECLNLKIREVESS